MTRAFVPGLELAELFHGEIVAPILRATLPGVPYSAALLGTGSEVQGFDTTRSTDHGWGPRLQIFLNSNDFRTHAERLAARLDRELPERFGGYPIRFAPPTTHQCGTTWTSTSRGSSSPVGSAPTRPRAYRRQSGCWSPRRCCAN